MKSMCQEERRNSPSVAVRSPTSSCIRTTSRIASSSTARSSSSSIRPSACSALASSSRRGRSRLPTWSALNGGVSRMLMRSPPDPAPPLTLRCSSAWRHSRPATVLTMTARVLAHAKLTTLCAHRRDGRWSGTGEREPLRGGTVLLERDGRGRVVGARMPHEVVRVFEHDPELLRGVAEGQARQLQRHVVTDVRLVASGASLAPPERASETFGLLVLDGLLARRVTLAGRGSVDLLGAGDLIRPWQDDGGLASLPAATSWRALQPTRIAILDAEFLGLVHRFPTVVAELLARAVEGSHVLLARLAIAQMPRLDRRLLAMFWHLADRWGRVEPGRVVVPVPVSHSVLAELVCAQRPSVSVALKHLIDDGNVERLPGGWALFGGPPSLPTVAPSVGHVAALVR